MEYEYHILYYYIKMALDKAGIHIDPDEFSGAINSLIEHDQKLTAKVAALEKNLADARDRIASLERKN